MLTDAPQEAWRGMEALVKEGLVRSIGLYGGGLEALQNVTAISKIAPAVIATELHPHCCNLELLDFCKSKVGCRESAVWLLDHAFDAGEVCAVSAVESLLLEEVP